jgi:hypothetical protein
MFTNTQAQWWDIDFLIKMAANVICPVDREAEEVGCF